jgi:hypothetical protein
MSIDSGRIWGLVNKTAFLNPFAKLRKASFSFVMPAYPYVRMEQLGSHWTDFHEILYLSIFLKICQENSTCIKIGQE